MNPRSTAKVLAFFLGMLLIVQSLIGVLVPASTLLHAPQDGTSWLIILMPVLIAVFIAWLLIRYSNRQDWESSSIPESNLLTVGIQILSLYLLAIGIPGIFAGLISLVFMLYMGTEIGGPFSVIAESVINVILGTLGIYRTKWFINLLGSST